MAPGVGPEVGVMSPVLPGRGVGPGRFEPHITPEYLRILIPPLREHLFGDRYTIVLNTFLCRTDRFQNSFFPDSVRLWNDLGPELRGAASISVFKRNILKIYRPMKKSLFNIHDPIGIKRIFQLRVGKSSKKS